MVRYILIIDYGKTFEEIYTNKEALFNRLLQLEDISECGEYAYMDILILCKGKAITSKIMKEYNFKKEKIGF